MATLTFNFNAEIDWDTDNEVIEDLPSNVFGKLDLEVDVYDMPTVEDLEIEVVDKLSDSYGFCISSAIITFDETNN